MDRPVGRLRSVALVLVVALAIAVGGCAKTTASKPLALTSVRLSPTPTLAPTDGGPIDVLGSVGLVLSSPDGGATWQTHAIEPTIRVNGFFWRLAAADPLHLWAIDRFRGEIAASSDGGRTWTVQYRKSHEQLLALTCSDPRHAWAVGFTAGSRPLILATSDGGATWTGRDTAPVYAAVPGHSPTVVTGVSFSDARHGWAVTHTSSDSVVLQTSDGGSHWRSVYETHAGGLFSVAAADPRHCWVVGSSARPDFRNEFAAAYVVATADGGRRWRTQVASGFEGLFQVACADRLHAWAVGYRGIILGTANGGRSWTMQHTDRGTMFDVACANARCAWAAEPQSSTLYATRDGGATWTAIRLSAASRFGFCALCVPLSARSGR